MSGRLHVWHLCAIVAFSAIVFTLVQSGVGLAVLSSMLTAAFITPVCICGLTATSMVVLRMRDFAKESGSALILKLMVAVEYLYYVVMVPIVSGFVMVVFYVFNAGLVAYFGRW